MVEWKTEFWGGIGGGWVKGCRADPRWNGKLWVEVD